jgi:GT2 family glycosyltransferase
VSVDHHNGSVLVINFHTIIPTYNRAPSLRRLLASLRALEYPPDVSLEIIVVNNRCTDETADLLKVEQAQKTQFTLRVLEETRKGKAAALNRGLSESNAEILAILDDDVVVDPAWLAEHLRAHRETAFHVVQGRVLPGRRVDNGRAADPRRLYEHNIPVIDYGEEFREVRGFAGTNVSLKREVFEKSGLFDTRLGPGAAGYSEDTEYSRRVRSAGFTIGYTPYAIAYHELDPGRYGRTYHRSAQYRKGVSRAIYRQESIARKVVPNLILNGIRYVAYRASGNRKKAYKTEGRIMKYWGYMIGRLRRAGFNLGSRAGFLLCVSAATSAFFLD